MTSHETIEFLNTSLSRNLDWIAAADAKTGFIFGLCTAMLGLLGAAAPKYGNWTVLGVTFAITATLPLLASLGSLTAAIFPRTEGPKLSLIFFGGISERSIDKYRSEVHALEEEGYIEDLIQQCHINAQIAGKKYFWVKKATITLYVALLPWIAATYILFRDRQGN